MAISIQICPLKLDKSLVKLFRAATKAWFPPPPPWSEQNRNSNNKEKFQAVWKNNQVVFAAILSLSHTHTKWQLHPNIVPFIHMNSTRMMCVQLAGPLVLQNTGIAPKLFK